jgi:hypothetical protein
LLPIINTFLTYDEYKKAVDLLQKWFAKHKLNWSS